MNADLRHRRVWLRREVIPRLEQGARRDLVAVLGRQAELLRADDELLESLAARQATDDVAALSALPAALARRIVRNWVATNSSGGLPPSSAAVDRVLAVARGETVATELPGGDRVVRAAGHLHLTRAPTPAPHSSRRADDSFDESSTRSEGVGAGGGRATTVRLAVPGRGEFGGLAVETWIEHSPPVAWPDGRFDAVCDADAVADQLDEFVIRGPEPGERFRPLGRGGSKPIRDALAEAGVPSGDRDVSPVVAARDPVWVVGYRIDHRVRVTSSTRRFLWLSVEPLTNA
jgi:tRNA(Ile)-lysidine synthetase-like protein